MMMVDEEMQWTPLMEGRIEMGSLRIWLSLGFMDQRVGGVVRFFWFQQLMKISGYVVNSVKFPLCE